MENHAGKNKKLIEEAEKFGIETGDCFPNGDRSASSVARAKLQERIVKVKTNKAIRELLGELRDFNEGTKESTKVNERLTKVLTVVAVMQFLIVLVQTVVMFFSSFEVWTALFFEASLIIVVIISLSYLAKAAGLEEEKKKKP